MTPELLDRLEAARAGKRPVVLATRLPDGEQHLLPDDDAPPSILQAAAKALRDDRSTTAVADGETWFLHVHNPPLRLVVVGAVHIAQALVPMAAQLGYGVTVVDPRRAFATDERFPGVSVSTEWPDDAMDALRPDTRTAVVTLTHDPKLDDPALDRALKSEAFYIGALGSKRTHARRLDRLRELGHDEAALQRIHGPVGIDIAAVTAPEIALSVLAQLVEVRRRGA
ncbi:MAG TPA: XdhC family protein [Acetobacteraceae bacterium]|nr:XdhC family protein [Acetobacteraceae bacterium]